MSESQSSRTIPSRGMPNRAQAEGLYDPANEHDACGVGFVVNIKGERSHDLLRSGLEILVNLSHRGACGCDPLTGDGCGVLTQMPDELLRAKTAEIGFELPPRGEYGAGAVFLPPDASQREFCEQRLEAIITEEGQKLLGWRCARQHRRARLAGPKR
jgi:glutamate synthase (NADPH) large chain